MQGLDFRQPVYSASRKTALSIILYFHFSVIYDKTHFLTRLRDKTLKLTGMGITNRRVSTEKKKNIKELKVTTIADNIKEQKGINNYY